MKSAKRNLIIAGIIGLILIVAAIVLAAVFNAWLDILYVVLIIVAAVTLISTLLLIFAVFRLIQTINLVNSETKPLLASVQETINVLKETAHSAGQTATTIGNAAHLTTEFAIAPSVRAAAAVVAGQQMLKVFLGKGHVGRRAERERRMEAEAAAVEMSAPEVPVAVEGD